jgi:hypothetical protein
VGRHSLIADGEGRHQQRQAEDGDHGNGYVPKRRARQVQGIDDLYAGQGEEGEAGNEPGDHEIGSAAVAVGPGRQDDRQDRQDARRDGGHKTGDEGDNYEQQHQGLVVLRPP